jgi:hypothetical protein
MDVPVKFEVDFSCVTPDFQLTLPGSDGLRVGDFVWLHDGHGSTCEAKVVTTAADLTVVDLVTITWTSADA